MKLRKRVTRPQPNEALIEFTIEGNDSEVQSILITDATKANTMTDDLEAIGKLGVWVPA